MKTWKSVGAVVLIGGLGVLGCGGGDDGPSLESTASNDTIMSCLRDSDLVDSVEIVQGDSLIDPYVGGVFTDAAGFTATVYDTAEEASANVNVSGVDTEGTVSELAPTDNVVLMYESNIGGDELDVLKSCTTES